MAVLLVSGKDVGLALDRMHKELRIEIILKKDKIQGRFIMWPQEAKLHCF